MFWNIFFVYFLTIFFNFSKYFAFAKIKRTIKLVNKPMLDYNKKLIFTIIKRLQFFYYYLNRFK